MSNNLQIFNFENQNIRMQIIQGKEYFCAKDICKSLLIKNGREATNKLEKDDVVLADAIDGLGRMQQMSFVNEAGLYALIFQARKSEAKKFKKWVFDEVLPQIRKTGKYENQITLPTTYKEALKSLLNEIEEKEKIQIELNESKNTLQNISQKKECYGLRETAKKLCIQEKELKSYLKKKNWIMYLDDELHPTAHATKNQFATISHEFNHKQKQFYPQFKITSKGFDFLANKRQEILDI
jgi:prophage antirepressor-like protein